MNESDLRKKINDDVKKITLENLPSYIDEVLSLVDINNMDEAYGAICVAVGGLAAATAWAINKSDKGGISGFQAGCIMWEFLGMFNHIKPPAKLLQMDDMLYPQNIDRFTSIDQETWNHLQEKAKLYIEQETDAHPNVIAHWKSIVVGVVPFGHKVE